MHRDRARPGPITIVGPSSRANQSSMNRLYPTRSHKPIALSKTGSSKAIRAKPLNRWNRPVTPDPGKLSAKLPASREFGAAPLSLNLALMGRPLSPAPTNRSMVNALNRTGLMRDPSAVPRHIFGRSCDTNLAAALFQLWFFELGWY